MYWRTAWAKHKHHQLQVQQQQYTGIAGGGGENSAGVSDDRLQDTDTVLLMPQRAHVLHMTAGGQQGHPHQHSRPVEHTYHSRLHGCAAQHLQGDQEAETHSQGTQQHGGQDATMATLQTRSCMQWTPTGNGDSR